MVGQANKPASRIPHRNRPLKHSARLLCLALSTGLLLGPAPQPASPFEAPNELVGFRACFQLMMWLVDSLTDACDLQMARYRWPAATNGPNLDHLTTVGALGPRTPIGRHRRRVGALRRGAAGTKPMNWRPGDEERPMMRTSGCWSKALNWLKGQLLGLRMKLLLGLGASLAEALATLAQLDRQLESV